MFAIQVRDVAAKAAVEPVSALTSAELMAAARDLEIARRHLDAAQLHVLAALDASGITENHTGLRTATWIAREVPHDERPTRRRVHLARRLAQLDRADQALTDGRISSDHVAVLDAAANPRIAEQIIALLPELIGLAQRLPYAAWAREVRAIAEQLDQDGGFTPDADPTRNKLTLSGGWHGELHLSGRFNADSSIELRGLLDDTADRIWLRYRDLRELDAAAVVPSRAQLLAEALLELARAGAAVDLASTKPARPDVTIVIHPDRSATLPDGTSVRQDLLNSVVERAHHLHGVRLHACGAPTGPATTVDGIDPDTELGRAIALSLADLLGDHPDRGPRYATRAMRRAATARDGGCVIPGCTMPAAWCDLHHVIHWEDDGPTTLPNLASLCRFHHGIVHRLGWAMYATADGWFWWQTPTGNRFWSQRHGIPRSGPPPSTGPPGTGRSTTDATLAY